MSKANSLCSPPGSRTPGHPSAWWRTRATELSRKETCNLLMSWCLSSLFCPPQATLNGVPLYNTTSYKGGHKKGQLVTLFGDDEDWIYPARGSITDLHIWSRIITEKGVVVCVCLFCSLHGHFSEMQDYSNCKTVAGGDLFSWDTAKLTLQDPTDIVMKSVSCSSHIQLQ